MTRAYRENREDTLFVIIMLFLTFLPSSALFNVIKMGVVFVLFIIKSTGIYKGFFFWFLNIFTAVGCVLLVEQDIILSNVTHEIMRLVYYALLVAVCMKCKITLTILFKICTVVILIHFTIQVTQYFRLGIVDNFIEQYYLTENTLDLHYIQAIEESYSFRSGSLFINPNVYVCYPCLCLGVFMQYYKKSGKATALIMMVIAFLSALLTGSRMGLVVFVFSLIVFFYKYFKEQEIRGFDRFTTVYLVIFCVLVFLLINWDTTWKMLSDFRAFNFTNAIEESLGIKFSSFLAYISVSSPLYWLLGCLGTSELTVSVDMEIGYIFAWYGIFGLYWYFGLLKTIYFKNKALDVIRTVTLITLLSNAVCASAILNMSVFPFICIVALLNIEIDCEMLGCEMQIKK